MILKLSKIPYVLLANALFILLAHLVSEGVFGAVGLFEYFIVLLYLSIFLLSFYFSLLLFSLNESKNFIFINYEENKFSKMFLALIFFSFTLGYIFFIGFEFNSFVELRSFLIGMYRSEEFSMEFKLLNTLGLILFYFATYFYLMKDQHSVIYILAALTFPLLMGNRNYILILFIFISYKLVVVKKNFSYLLILFFVFFVLNMIYVYVFDKGVDGVNIIASTVNSLIEYAATPLHGLSYSLANPQNYGDYLTIPSSLVVWLGYDVNREFLYTPHPNTTNVYTLFFSLIYDFGLFGVAFFAAIFGAFHAYLYFKSKYNVIFLFVYIYSFYPLLMTFFDNVYTSSPGAWVYIFVPFLFFKKVKIRRCSNFGYSKRLS